VITAALLAACGGEAAPSSSVSSESPASVSELPPRAPEVPPSAPPVTDLVGLDDPPPVPDDAPVAAGLHDTAAPAHGCVLVSDGAQRVLEQATAADVIDVGHGFVVAAYLDTQPEALGIARFTPGAAPQLLARVELTGHLDAARRVAPPILAHLGETELGVALVDAQGAVRFARFDGASPATAVTLRTVTEHDADPRFAPALSLVSAGTVVAWSDAHERTLRVRVALVDAPGAVVATHDVVPEAGASAAPVFDGGLLYTIDPRAGISVVHRTRIADDGTPGTPEVAEPLNLAAEPPAFAIVGTHLAYAAVGNMATRAVGLVATGSEARPTPLVAGLGYGSPLTLDGLALGGGAALFAMEAPSAAPADAPHEVRLRVAAADGSMGEALVVAGHTAPRIARTDDGLVALATRGALVQVARCGP
jgi:hypothetical protein